MLMIDAGEALGMLNRLRRERVGKSDAIGYDVAYVQGLDAAITAIEEMATQIDYDRSGSGMSNEELAANLDMVAALIEWDYAINFSGYLIEAAKRLREKENKA